MNRLASNFDVAAEVEAELFFIGGLLRDPRRIESVVELVKPEDFSEAFFGAMYDVIVREHAKGEEVSAFTIRPFICEHPGFEAMGGNAFLANITVIDTLLAAPVATAKGIAKAARRRRLVEGLSEAAAQPEAEPVERMIELADSAIVEATVSAKGSERLTGAQGMAKLAKAMKEDRRGVTCRLIPSFDDVVGPLRPKSLNLLAGRPGMGKTAVALSYALGAAQNGHGVLFVSLEMSSDELCARAASEMSFGSRGQVPYSEFTKEGPPSREVMVALADAEARMADMPFEIIDTGGMTISRLAMEVRRNARRLAAKGESLGLVVVDYAQLLRTDARSQSPYERISEVSMALKAIAKDNDVAVLALAQLSREVEKRADKRPMLSDLRDSGQLEQDADTIIFLLREEYYVRKEKAEGWEAALQAVQNEIEFICAKRRHGIEGSAKGQFYGQYQAVRG